MCESIKPARVTTGYLVKWQKTPDGFEHWERIQLRKHAYLRRAELRSVAYHNVHIVRLYRRVRGL